MHQEVWALGVQGVPEVGVVRQSYLVHPRLPHDSDVRWDEQHEVPEVRGWLNMQYTVISWKLIRIHLIRVIIGSLGTKLIYPYVLQFCYHIFHYSTHIIAPISMIEERWVYFIHCGTLTDLHYLPESFMIKSTVLTMRVVESCLLLRVIMSCSMTGCCGISILTSPMVIRALFLSLVLRDKLEYRPWLFPMVTRTTVLFQKKICLNLKLTNT